MSCTIKLQWQCKPYLTIVFRIKARHSSRLSPRLFYGTLLRENILVFPGSRELRKKQISEITLPQKNGPRILTPYSKSIIMVSFCRKKNVLATEITINGILFMMLKKLTIGQSTPYIWDLPEIISLISCSGKVRMLLNYHGLNSLWKWSINEWRK